MGELGQVAKSYTFFFSPKNFKLQNWNRFEVQRAWKNIGQNPYENGKLRKSGYGILMSENNQGFMKI